MGIEGVAGVDAVAVLLGALVVSSLGFARYVFTHAPFMHDLPVVWAVLVLLECAISPALDVINGTWLFAEPAFVDASVRALGAALLFVWGAWVGVHVCYRRENARSRRDAVGGFRVSASYALWLILAMDVVSIVAQFVILRNSGALLGQYGSARGAGLVGTSILLPLLRVGSFATLLSAWLSLTAVSRQYRRIFAGLAWVSLAMQLPMPILLQQRFGILQAVGYLALPYVVASKASQLRWRVRILLLLPSVLAMIWYANLVTLGLRDAVVSGEGIAVEKFDKYIEMDGGPTHFRHVWLLADLLNKGMDDLERSRVSAVPLVIGDMAIVVPRVIFPDKPLTTMEFVNSVALGREFRAVDRGSSSVYTAGIWSQFYLLFGFWAMLPGAAAFTFASCSLWRACLRRWEQGHFVVLGVGLWMSLGWLAMNVALTTIEVPGMLLGVAVSALIARRGNPRSSAARV